LAPTSFLKATLAGRPRWISRQVFIFLVAVLLCVGYQPPAYASVKIKELLDRGDNYHQQALSVMGHATGITILAGPRNLPFYTFNLDDGEDTPETLTVIMQGKPEFTNGDRVYVYGVFFKSRKAGRTTITNRIEATIVERLHDGGEPLVA
jgi:hypothetical protein